MRLQTFAAISLSLSLGFLLTGCSLSSTALHTPEKGLAMHGNLHGGSQPISGAHIYLFAAGTTGYGQPSISLLDSASTGNSDSLLSEE